MPALLKKLYSPAAFDALFGLLGLVGLAGLMLEAGRAYPAIAPAAEPLVKGGALAAVLLASTVISISSTRFDQNQADDYLFHALSKSAFIAMMTIVFTAVLWKILLAGNLGAWSSNAMLGVLVAAWSVCWFYTRSRGTRA
jgi:hypothetical protein